MSGRPHITIAESVEVLLEIRKQQKRILAYNKVQMLYLFQSKKVETVREVSSVLGKSETTIHRWLFQYKEGGLENLLKNRQIFGRPKKFSVEVAASLQQELRDSDCQTILFYYFSLKNPEANPTERVWEYIKEFLAWLVFTNLDQLRVKVQEILSSLTNNVIGFLTGWSWILHSLSLAHL